MAFDWGQLLGTAVNAYGAYQGSQNQANQYANAAQSTRPNPYSTFSPYGSVVNQGGALQFNPGQNPFSQMFMTGGLQQAANAFSAPGAAYYGAPKEVVAAAGAANNTDAEAGQRLEFLRQQSAPDANRQAVALRERLFGRGTLGSSGGAAEQRAFLESQDQADLQRQMTSQDWANQRAQQRFSNALSATGFGANLQQNQFNQAAAAQTAQQSPFSLLLQQGGLGVGAGGGVAPGAAMAAAQANVNQFDTKNALFGGLAQMGIDAWQNRGTKTTMPVGYGGDPRAVGY